MTDDEPTNKYDELGLHNILVDLYSRSPYQVTTIESFEMDRLLKSLKTPAHHALYTIHHAFQHCKDVQEALLHCHHLVKPDYSLIFDQNSSNEFRKHVEKSHGKDAMSIDDSLLLPGLYFHTNQRSKGNPLLEGWNQIYGKKAMSTKKILQRLTSVSKSGKSQASSKTISILKELYNHLFTSLGTDVRDGTADIALTLSMIPIHTEEEATQMNTIMDVLTHVAALEIERRSMKISRRSVEILMIVEKLAAAGCEGIYMDKALYAARLALPNSQNYDTITKDTLDSLMTLNLWSSRSLLWLWRKGHVFHKVTEKDFNTALTLEDLCRHPPLFDDPTLPLVVDVGCGLGISLLGLACDSGESRGKYQLDLNWTEYNYLGSDLSLTAIQWANALALRRGISKRCKFVHACTETVLEYLNRMKIDVKLILLQFPTPYRLQGETSLEHEKKGPGCNEKLPLGPEDPTFMANETILRQMVTILGSHKDVDQKRYILLQSNCEDVALNIYDSLIALGLKALNIEKSRISFDEQTISSRTKSWLEIQRMTSDSSVNIRRAAGYHWADEPLIPVRTETEVSSEYQSTPVHRCVFKR